MIVHKEILKNIFQGTPPQFLTKAEIHLTNQCNYRCEFCFLHSPLLAESHKKSSMPGAQALKIVKDLVRFGVKEICLTAMGEPSYHPDFIGLVNFIKDKGVVLSTFTNLSAVSPKILEAYMRMDRLSVNLSAVDALSYRSVHAPKNRVAFSHVLKNIRMAVQAKHPRIELVFIITKNNFRDIGKALELACFLGVERIKFKMIIKGPQDLHLDKAKVVELLREIDRLLGIPASIHSNLSDLRAELLSPDNVCVSFRRCFVGYLRLRILDDGGVVFCCLNNVMRVGNWKKESMGQIWNGVKAQRWRILGRDELGSGCLSWENCHSCNFARDNAAIGTAYESFLDAKDARMMEKKE
ncbi:MAG: radical SAM protein [Candidatus Omnitrophota bacterium]